VKKPKGRRPPERSRRRWEDNIKTNLREVEGGHGLDLYGSEQGPVACSCKCSNEPPSSIKCGKFF
jgi:hypothetical protein